jgi:prophage regulatory protein
MPRRLAPPTSQTTGPYIDKRTLVAIVPLSMTTIDRLEKAGIFPSRFILQPTKKVCWKRREIERFMEKRAAERVHTQPAE